MRMTKIKQQPTVGENEGKGGPFILCWWNYKLVQTLCKSMWKVFKKLKSNLLYDPAIPFLGIQAKDLTSFYSTDISSAMFIAVLFTIARIWNQPRCPTTKK